MTKTYARIANGIVAEIIALPEDTAPGEAFHADIVASLVPSPVEVQAGWTYDDKKFSKPVIPGVPLEESKTALRAAIDARAEAERMRYITPGEGQAMTYQQKVAEARAFQADSGPDEADYPMLASEVGISGATLAEVAAIVLAMNAQWAMIGSGIERSRLGAKKAVDAADSMEAAQAVLNDIKWPVPPK